MSARFAAVVLISAAVLGVARCGNHPPIATPEQSAVPSPPLPTPTVAAWRHVSPPAPPTSPYALISVGSMISSLEELTAIQPYSGWRNSATAGEAQALDYLMRRLEGLEYLRALGMELERQHFHVFLATELWETHLYLTREGKEIEVPAAGMRGEREDITRTLWFDSDGALNDQVRNPVVAEGKILPIRSPGELEALSSAKTRGRIAFVNYEIVDLAVRGPEAVPAASRLLALEPAGVVLVTRFSNRPGESHGTFAGEGGAMAQAKRQATIPILYVRLEDMAAAGIADWDDLACVESARLVWDADVLSPANSGNLIARIPGLDTTHAVILGAHVDSPNSPGALDDGSGSVILLEIARVLDAARLQPPVDLYLAWFGSEELGLYGSYHFAATYQELLDRTLAMLQIDMLSCPLEGVNAKLNLVSWACEYPGDNRLAWADYLAGLAERRGIQVFPLSHCGIESDNAAFPGFDVPEADLMYTDHEVEPLSRIHYISHIHDPYDTVELAREKSDVLAQMAQVALSAALELDSNVQLRSTPRPTHRLLFVGSHTEPVHMAPTTFVDFGRTMAMEGFDVDILPYGQPVTPSGLEDADLVIVLPVLDYPAGDSTVGAYDEAWSADEIAVLKDYVARGGLLVLTNSAQRLKYFNRTLDFNEDWDDVNLLAEQFGISYFDGAEAWGGEPELRRDHPLMMQVDMLELAGNNAIPFKVSPVESADAAQWLARMRGSLIAALVRYGERGGEVLALADVGILNTSGGEPANLTFWRNLARYARTRNR